MNGHGTNMSKTMDNFTKKVIPLLWEFFRKRQHRLTGINVTMIENELIISILTKKKPKRFSINSIENLNANLKTF